MSACPEWRERILDHALGLPASVELAGHLEECFACALALTAWRAQADRLDAGVRHLVTSEPSLYFRARVMSAVASAAANSRWILGWRAAMASLALLAALTLIGHFGRRAIERREQAQEIASATAAISNWSSPTQALLRSPADPLLKTVPRLGELYFEINTVAGETKLRKGGENAN